MKNIKPLDWGIFALLTLVVAYYFGSRTGKGKGTAANPFESEYSNTQLTYELSQYSAFADRLQAAMQGLADDEESIYSVLSKLRTKTDLFQLMKSFGNRRIPFTIGSADLSAWLNYRLSKKELNKANEILSRNNIDYQF
jgi:hypothetical protein